MPAAAIIAHLTELAVTLAFAVACLNAVSQSDGRRQLSTVLWGAVAGLSLECALVSSSEASYDYDKHNFWLTIGDVPIFIGLGWGTIFYITTWTADRLRLRSRVETAFVAGILAVNLDLSLDPTAAMNKFWNWKNLGFNQGFFGIPFDNLITWVAIIAAYSLSTKLVFIPWQKKLVKHRALRDFTLPPLGAAAAAGVFALVRGLFDPIYNCLGHFASRAADAGGASANAYNLGQACIFIPLFVAGLVIFGRNVLRARRDQPVNWAVLYLALFFHLLSVLLFLTGMVRAPERVTFTPIAVIIPINAIVGFLAFAWPSIDLLFKNGRSGQRRVLFEEVPLSSYSGGLTGYETVRALVASPSSKEELCAAIAYGKQSGSKVTFRGGGHSFDSQSLNDGLVISLARLKQITLAPDHQTVTVECGATWREILETTLPVGRVPHVMITSGSATAGGTLSANSLSRFSAFEGREGKHVESFQLVTPNGDVLTCSRAENADLFCAVIGGLGYVGCVLKITHRLREVDANARVRSEFRIFEGIPSIAGAIELARELKSHKLARMAEPGAGGAALSAAMYLRGRIRGLVASSTYVAGDTPLQPSLFHTPRSFGHRLLQFLAMIPACRTIGFWLTYNVFFRGKPKTFVDEAYGYSFFEDGNVWVRNLLKAFGVPVPILQQTFILPDGDDDEPDLEAFFVDAAALLDAHEAKPTLVDVLYLPADEDDFLLSSSRGMAGFAVTFTFESLFFPLRKERTALEKLSEACAKRRGRVHLVKNVCATPETIAEMYGTRIDQMNAIRERLGGENVRNEFADRILPGLR